MILEEEMAKKVDLIGGQVQLVKASVGRWQPICRPEEIMFTTEK